MLTRGATLWGLTGIFMALASTALFFGAFPNFDLIPSGVFAPFPMRTMPIWQYVRATMIALTDGTMLVVLGLFLLGFVTRGWRLPRREVLGFALASYALGPGLITNMLFKQRWGRARPVNVTAFGGSAQFSPPLQPADQCHGSCAFISGEASALFTVATVVLLIIIPWMPRRWRLPASIAVLAVACAGSALRIAFGGHFLSDVLFAALISSAITLILYLALSMDRLPGLFSVPPNPTERSMLARPRVRTPQ